MTQPIPDAPQRVWAVRQVPPPGSTSDIPERTQPFYQATVYKRTVRRQDGLSVWRVEGLLAPPAAAYADAEKAGLASALGTPAHPNVRAFSLACRLDEVVPSPAHRAMVRLGEGWRLALAVQRVHGRRGVRYLAAICEHDLPKAPVVALTDYLNVINIRLVKRIGRFNEDQIQALIAFVDSYGIHTLGATSMPTKAGNVLNPKHLRLEAI